MPDSDTDQAVIASFDSTAQAEQAAHDLMGWAKANDDVKLGAIGMLTSDDKGGIKTRNFSQRNTRKGAKVGMGLGVAAAIFSGGLTLIPTAIGGAVAGGAAGTLFRKGLGMSDEELQELGSELAGGRAALLVMCDASDVDATTAYLTAAGGKPRSHTIASADLESAAKQAATATTAAADSSSATPTP